MNSQFPSPQSRMGVLRTLLKEKQSLEHQVNQLTSQLQALQEKHTRASIKFQDYRDDIIGDLFNGCFGSEWLLEEF